MATTFDTILTSLADGVLTITMNRPERLNAWTYQMGDELQQAIEAANADDDVEAIVVTGAGRGFCAGADIKDLFQKQAESGNYRGGSSQPRDWVGLVRRSKPLVAAINGAAIGVGLTQVLPMDVLIASEDAKLSVRFIKMGLVPELASSHFLLQRVGFGRASELMLSGKTVTGVEACEIGLVDKVCKADELMPLAIATAKSMGENPLAAVLMVKALITENMSESDIAKIQQRELESLMKCYQSPEHKEAIAAFVEKREPDFRTARSAG